MVGGDWDAKGVAGLKSAGWKNSDVREVRRVALAGILRRGPPGVHTRSCEGSSSVVELEPVRVGVGAGDAGGFSRALKAANDVIC